MMIDAHLHFVSDSPGALAMLRELDLKLLNICVAYDAQGPWRQREAVPYERLSRLHPEHYAWITSFDAPEFAAPGFTAAGYAVEVIAGLERDFTEGGAVGCKIWKNVGMDSKLPDGSWLMPDHDVFDPIYAWLAANDRTLLAHLGEPLQCWLPLGEPGTPHSDYYRGSPEWHMYGKPGMPQHAEIIAARDGILEKHPTLRVVGAHLGSLEYDVDELAARFERYPHFAVDTSARLLDLLWQDQDKVRRFLLQYPDRVLFGTDIVARTPYTEMSAEQQEKLLRSTRENIETNRRYFCTTESVTLNTITRTGLGLPPDVTDKLFRANALSWYPGL